MSNRPDNMLLMNIYEIADAVQEQINRYHPRSYPTWSKLSLYEFDCKTRGTKAELEKKRNEFELQLHIDYEEYVTTMRKNQSEQYDIFKAALAEEFLRCDNNLIIPQSVSDRIYYRAYEEGHSAGLRDVVSEYGELSAFVLQCIIACT